jgi:rod shape-determining protein MreC
LQDENAQLKRARLENVTTLLRTQQLEVENERLRKLLGVKERQQASGQLGTDSLFGARSLFAANRRRQGAAGQGGCRATGH